MKNIIPAIAAALMLLSCSKSEEIALTFNVENPSIRSVAVVCNSDVTEVRLDSTGNGTCTISGRDAVFARIFYGTESKTVYLERGDNPCVSFSGSNFSGTFNLSGRKGPAAEYLNSIVLTALPDEDYSLPFDEFLSRTGRKISDAVSLLKARDLRHTGNFVRMEEGRIRYSYANTLLMYPVAHRIMSGDQSYTPDESYYDEIRKYAVADPEYSDIDEYREFMAESAHVLDPENRDITDLYPKLLAEMRYTAANCGDSKTLQAILHHIAVPYIDSFGTAGAQDMINIYRTYVTDPSLLAVFSDSCDRWDAKKPGRKAPDFRAADINGREYTLADFRGKYVYIDIWATWCQPCRRELPYLKALEQKFEGKEIVFLGLSVDSDRAKWEAKVRSGELSGIQLYLGDSSEFTKAYGISGIPHFILIGKDGTTVNPDMTRPSSGDTAEYLGNLAGI